MTRAKLSWLAEIMQNRGAIFGPAFLTDFSGEGLHMLCAFCGLLWLVLINGYRPGASSRGIRNRTEDGAAARCAFRVAVFRIFSHPGLCAHALQVALPSESLSEVSVNLSLYSHLSQGLRGQRHLQYMRTKT